MISAIRRLALLPFASAVMVLISIQGAAQAPGTLSSAGPALWQVADEDTTIYLFGSIHLLPGNVDWLRGPLQAAFDGALEFVSDVDVTKIAAFAPTMLAAGTLPAEQNLRSLMSPADRSSFEAALSALGMPAGALDRLEPWMAAQVLQSVILTRGGYAAVNGVDMVLAGMAAEKQRSALETLEFQLQMHDTTPLNQQLAFLADIVEWAPMVREWNDRMVALWLAGEAHALADHIATAYADPDYYDRILTRRNASWAAWIDSRLDAPGTVFIAVGAGHLGGRGSVQEMLSRHGIETTRKQ
jgi:uncharacterized protein YbaP (TraB family)